MCFDGSSHCSLVLTLFLLIGECQGLAKTPTSRSSLKATPHYLVLDTNIVLEQIDLLESEGLEHVIVLTTVLEEVRHRSSPIFKRIKDIIANPNVTSMSLSTSIAGRLMLSVRLVKVQMTEMIEQSGLLRFGIVKTLPLRHLLCLKLRLSCSQTTGGIENSPRRTG